MEKNLQVGVVNSLIKHSNFSKQKKVGTVKISCIQTTTLKGVTVEAAISRHPQ